MVEKAGRRPLLLASMGITAISTFGSFITIGLIQQGVGMNILPYISIGFIILFLMGFAPGLGNITDVRDVILL